MLHKMLFLLPRGRGAGCGGIFYYRFVTGEAPTTIRTPGVERTPLHPRVDPTGGSAFRLICMRGRSGWALRCLRCLRCVMRCTAGEGRAVALMGGPLTIMVATGSEAMMPPAKFPVYAANHA